MVTEAVKTSAALAVIYAPVYPLSLFIEQYIPSMYKLEDTSCKVSTKKTYLSTKAIYMVN